MANLELSKNGNNYNCNNLDQISFQDLSYSVPQRRYVCLSSRPKPVLQSVSGIFRSGLNAILGPTGSGKTSLMDLLAGRISHRRFTGDIRVNGQPQPDHFRFMAGYVVQQDFLEGVLSVRENIHFSASLRLSKRSLSQGESDRQQRARLVEEVIDKLGLSEVADSRIGTDFSRGVSGGERKRTHIATELVIAPSILFLDEPTSGLDAYTALKLMRQLKTLSQEGRLIVVTLHQPRYAILRLLDRVTLLSAGETVYHGEWTDVTGYFSEIGYQCEEKENPGDFLLDTIFKEKNKDNKIGERYITDNQMIKLSTKFNASNQNQHLMATLENIHSNNIASPSKPSARYATNIFSQMLTLSNRTMRVFLRFPYPEILQFIFNILAIGIVKFFTWNTDLSLDGLQNRLTLTIVLLCLMSTICAPYLTTFFFSKKQLYFETNHCYYRVSAYFLSKILTEIIPRCILPALLTSFIYYFVQGFVVAWGNIGIFLLVIFSYTFAETALISLIAMSSGVEFQAMFLKGYLLFIMVSFSGFFFNIQETHFILEYFTYLSFYRLSYSTILANELSGLDFCHPIVRNLTGDGSCPHFDYRVSPEIVLESHTSGDDYLAKQGISVSNPFDIWIGIILLLVYGCILYSLTYLKLRLFARKQ
ncbi:ATP-binding cassette sub-family G member 2 [Oopsacas minuta]|uniref:ATP-binding cassette sub-family G member 2 n=1 Tax=Oopsacas minuta TaxID=111878 RepID=A0AAV7JKH7_9METZ|nr:ATP-binding cassette sub-family G member 2 [Oopsacas minuta]